MHIMILGERGGGKEERGHKESENEGEMEGDGF
jgi:hypothetical protein